MTTTPGAQRSVHSTAATAEGQARGHGQRVRPAYGPGVLALAVCLALAWGWAGCDLRGTPGGTGTLGHRSEVVIQAAAGVEGAVQIDSLSWLPLAPELNAGQDEGVVDGTFAARFVNSAQTGVQVSYDLRFLDVDEFLIDVWHPFGQPVRLAPGQVQHVTGDFTVRASDPAELDRMAVMSLHATVAAAQQ